MSDPDIFSIVIAALDGDGGNALADWLAGAARASGFSVQRTRFTAAGAVGGAAGWYIELGAQAQATRSGRAPLFSAAPAAGEVDLLIATELIEAGRAVRAGYASADRTVTIASTHRVLTAGEKMAPAHPAFDATAIPGAVRALSRESVLIDMEELAAQARSSIGAVALGAAGHALPFPPAACETSIRASGHNVGAALRGFRHGLQNRAPNAGVATPLRSKAAPRCPVELADRVAREFPAPTSERLLAAVTRLAEYQDVAYGALFLDRMRQVLAVERESGGEARGYPLVLETARLLTRWMAYDDIARIAQVKSQPARLARIRAEAGAGRDDCVDIFECLPIRPGALDDELPRSAAILARCLGAEPATNTVAGFLVLRALAACRRWRRDSRRYAREQALIDRWLGALKRLGFAALDLELALEIARCAELVRGYGGARGRGLKALADILERVIEGGGEDLNDATRLRDAVRRERLRALGLAVPGKAGAALSGQKTVTKPLVFMKRERKPPGEPGVPKST